ncbi:putative immunity protein [Intrasporangium flavum]|uniref:putative immunity protein n=1 Tax=Intrasporangium flavum TaxID=1428657 RepID=UPI00096FF879|nr:exonuclease SbcC [Intrasporangium flavum]
MPDTPDTVDLTLEELREVTAFATRCAETVLPLYERALPDDPRPREAVEAAGEFAGGAARSKALRTAAWAAYRAALEAPDPVASNAAHAASAACGAAFLHPLAKATQVKHVVGSAAYAALAVELDAGDSGAADAVVARVVGHASPVVVDVLRRFPDAPGGGGRVGGLVRAVDAALRAR